MSGCPWEINGLKLQDTNVRTSPTRLNYGLAINHAKTDLLGGGVDRQRTNKQLGSMTVEFTLLGRGTDKFDRLDAIVAVVEDDDVWSLQAPVPDPIYAYRNVKRVALSTEKWDVDLMQATGAIKITVTANVEGIWIADGGAYCETVTGWFDYNGSTYTRQPDGFNTGATPLLELPEQTTGYPKGVRASDFAEVTIPGPDSIRYETLPSGDTVTYASYDMTDYVVPAISGSGDTGRFKVCSSPTDAFLSGGEGTLGTLSEVGIGSQQIASFQIGSG